MPVTLVWGCAIAAGLCSPRPCVSIMTMKAKDTRASNVVDEVSIERSPTKPTWDVLRLRDLFNRGHPNINAPAVKRIPKNRREESLPYTKMPCLETGRVPFNPKSVRVEKIHSSSLSKNGLFKRKMKKENLHFDHNQHQILPRDKTWFGLIVSPQKTYF